MFSFSCCYSYSADAAPPGVDVGHFVGNIVCQLRSKVFLVEGNLDGEIKNTKNDMQDPS